MKKELKTLRDLRFAILSEFDTTPETLRRDPDTEEDDTWDENVSVVRIDDLKQEAIKHIKFLDSKDYDFDITCDPGEVIHWIKHFFNITEEDLLNQSIVNTPAPKFEKEGMKHITTS